MNDAWHPELLEEEEPPPDTRLRTYVQRTYNVERKEKHYCLKGARQRWREEHGRVFTHLIIERWLEQLRPEWVRVGHPTLTLMDDLPGLWERNELDLTIHAPFIRRPPGWEQETFYLDAGVGAVVIPEEIVEEPSDD